MADLKLRIDKLVGSLSRARRPAGRAQAQLPASPPLLRAVDSGFGEAVAQLFAMSLDRYAREGAQLEIRVPWQAETPWLVPTERDAATLARGGVGRGRVWTGRELIALMALPDRTPEIVQSLALAKRAVGGDIVEHFAGSLAAATDVRAIKQDLLPAVPGSVSDLRGARFRAAETVGRVHGGVSARERTAP